MLVIGGLLFLVAVLVAPSIYTSWRDWRAAHAVPAATARPHQAVVASGVVVPGPGGVLSAPLSGRPCVWNQQETRRHLRRPTRSGIERDVQVESVTTSDRQFGVTDDHGRVVMIAPDGLRQKDLLWAHREERDATPQERVQPGTGRTLPSRPRTTPYETTGYETLEWIVEQGQSVVISGVLAPDGQVTAPRRGTYVIRTADLADVQRRRTRVLVFAVVGTVVLAGLGLVLTLAGI